jgi:hypothetical protein
MECQTSVIDLHPLIQHLMLNNYEANSCYTRTMLVLNFKHRQNIEDHLICVNIYLTHLLHHRHTFEQFCRNNF